MTRAAVMITLARDMIGQPYLLGAKWRNGEWPPTHSPVDCSGLWTWAASMMLKHYPLDMVQTAAGLLPTHQFLSRFEGSANQGSLCRQVPKVLALGPTGQGIFLFMRPGADHHGHVAMSLGFGRTVESRGGKGVCIVGPLDNLRRWAKSDCYAAKLDLLFQQCGGGG